MADKPQHSGRLTAHIWGGRETRGKRTRGLHGTLSLGQVSHSLLSPREGTCPGRGGLNQRGTYFWEGFTTFPTKRGALVILS